MISPDASPDTGLDVGPSKCPGDPFEPNDDDAAATVWQPQFANQDTFLCVADPDFFSFTAAKGAVIDVRITFAAEVDLFDLPQLGRWEVTRAGAVVGAGQLAGEPGLVSEVSISLTTAEAGTHVLSLRAQNNVRWSYRLRITVSTSTVDCGVPDAFEPNNVRASMPRIEPGVYPNLTVCGGTSPDWDGWVFDLDIGDTARATIDYVRTATNVLQISLFDPEAFGGSGGIILGTDTMVEVTPSTPSTHTYYLGVDPGPQTTGVEYTLTFAITRGEGPPPCVDAVEDDTVETASTTLAAGLFADDSVCVDDDDFIAITAEQDDLIEVGATYATRFGDPTLTLFAPDGTTILADSSGQTDAEDRIVATAEVTGTYYLRVRLEPGGKTTAYRIGYYLGRGIPCSADPQEPNDDPLTDTLAALGGTLTGYACVGEEDWFSVVVTEPTMLLDVAADDGGTGTLAGSTVTLFATNATTELASGFARLAYILASGDYLVRLRMEPLTSNLPYTLTSTLVDAAICEDALEPNDSAGQRKPVAPGGVTDLGLCINDNEDFYGLTLSEGQSATVRLDFVHAEGDLTLYILRIGGEDASDAYRISSTTNDFEEATWTAQTNATYTILVRGDVKLSEYSMTITVP